MINHIHALFHRPENGWDPVPSHHIFQYADKVWEEGIDVETLILLEKWLGGFEGKKILDLGGGPGQWSIAFALRGANVTWFDISNGYKEYAQKTLYPWRCGSFYR